MGCLERLDDRDGEVGEVRVLGLWRRVFFLAASKESLHLNSAVAPGIAVAQNEARDVNDALPVSPDLDLPICLADIVELDTLRDCGPLPGGERPRAPAYRRAIGRVTRGEGRDVAYALVGGESRDLVVGEVGVKLSLTTGTEHEARRVALRRAPSTGAADSDLSTVADPGIVDEIKEKVASTQKK